MNIAFVYDRVNKIGGAERMLLALHELWPDAPLFTSVFEPSRALWARPFRVIGTFLEYFPFAKTHHEWFALFMPFAFGSFSFDEYDVVLSVTSAEAKGIVTKPETLHICLCLTPTRYLWSGVDTYKLDTGFGVFHGIIKYILTLFLPMLRDWDMVASQRPDMYIAISRRVEQRIRTYYGKKADIIIYPPVDTDFFRPAQIGTTSNQYYLIVSRLVPYKRIDIVIRACSSLHKKLIVIGDGVGKKYLEHIAGPEVTFISGNLTDDELLRYYQHCRAFLFAGDEDFGITAVEAQSCGKPVIAYKESGISEIVVHGKTGIVFTQQSEQSLKGAILQFEAVKILPSECRKNALRFRKSVFQKAIQEFICQQFRKQRKTL